MSARVGVQSRTWEGVGETSQGFPAMTDQSNGCCRKGLPGEQMFAGRSKVLQNRLLL